MEQGYPGGGGLPTGATPREAIAALFRQKRLMGGVFLVTCAIAAGVTAVLPNRYESRMKVLVKGARPDMIVSADRTPMAAQAGEVTEAQVNSEIELLRSRNLLEDVVKLSGLAGPAPEAIEKAVRKLERELRVSPVRKTNVIEIGYESKSPEETVGVLRALSDLYQERHLEVHRVPGTNEFFRGQALEYERRLREAEQELARFEKQHRIVSLTTQKESGLKRVADTEAEMLGADATGRETAERIARLKQQLDGLDPRVVTLQRTVPHQFSIERLTTMLVELRQKRVQLLARFKPEDRLVREVEQQLADTAAALEQAERQKAVEQSSDLNPQRQALELELKRAQAELAAKQARRESLAEQLASSRASLGTLDDASLKHAELERRIAEMKENYQLFARKRDESVIADALDQRKISNVAIAEAPTMPALPSSPNRPLNLALGIFLAGFLGLGAGVSAEFLRDTVATPRELEAAVDYPVLATMPFQHLLGDGSIEGRGMEGES